MPAKRLTQEEFLKKCKEIHGNNYDYSLVEYETMRKNIKIICPIHGIFEQNASKHSSGCGCPKCNNGGKSTKNEFINKSNKKHNNKYNYSLVDYTNNKTKVKIICPIHGIFEQRPDVHSNQGQGCPECKKEKLSKLKRKRKELFIKESKEIHGDKYDYSLVKYLNTEKKVKIICPIHGVFKQTPHNHLGQKQGCPKCFDRTKTRWTKNQFIKKAKKIHGNKYDYSKVIYFGSKIKVKIICPIHGIFKQKPCSHIGLGTCGCPKCNESKGEKAIRIYLENKNIDFVYQKKFDNCKSKKNLRFDFHLPNENLIIEYDGEQHFNINEFFGGKEAFKKLKNNDKIKNDFCKENKINLIRIPFFKFNEINNILNKNLNEKYF
jgi:very-short-patch-repair endonuclease